MVRNQEQTPAVPVMNTIAPGCRGDAGWAASPTKNKLYKLINSFQIAGRVLQYLMSGIVIYDVQQGATHACFVTDLLVVQQHQLEDCLQ